MRADAVSDGNCKYGTPLVYPCHLQRNADMTMAAPFIMKLCLETVFVGFIPRNTIYHDSSCPVARNAPRHGHKQLSFVAVGGGPGRSLNRLLRCRQNCTQEALSAEGIKPSQLLLRLWFPLVQHLSEREETLLDFRCETFSNMLPRTKKILKKLAERAFAEELNRRQLRHASLEKKR